MNIKPFDVSNVQIATTNPPSNQTSTKAVPPVVTSFSFVTTINPLSMCLDSPTKPSQIFVNSECAHGKT